MSNKKILKVIKFQGKRSSTRGIKTKKLQGGRQFDPPGLDRVKSRQKGKILKDQQEVLTDVKTFYEQFYGKKTMFKSGFKSIIALQ